MRAHTGDWLADDGSQSTIVMTGTSLQHENGATERDAAALRSQVRLTDKETTPAVVVGVDGSAESLVAVRWAAQEADIRGLPLRLVYAIDPADAAAALPSDPERAHRVAQKALDLASAQAKKACQGSAVQIVIVDGSPAQALVRDGGPAAMICVGASGPAPAHPGHHASVVTEIIVAADCPITVLRTEPVPHGWVVAEVNSEPGATDVLRIALEEATLRQLPLRILTGPHSAYGTAPASQIELRERVERSVDRWRARYPSLDAITVAPSWGLGQYLERYAGNIALFVAPPRQIHDIGTILHPTAVEALAVLQCPVTLCVGSCAL